MDRQQPSIQDDHAFDEALKAFESALEVPFVPGELERWIDAVEGAFTQVRPRLQRRLQHAHPDEFAEIGEADPGLIRRVEQMREEDAALREETAELADRITALRSAITSVEPDEARVETMLETFIEQALQFVIRVRKQEQAVRTWLMEAFNRDRGTID